MAKSKNKKNGEKLINHMDFCSCPEAEKEMNRAKTWIIISGVFAAISIPLTVLSFTLDNSEVALLFTFIGAILALVCGKVIYTLKFVGKFAKFCWFVVPLFPFDLIIGFFGALLALIGIFMFPTFICAYNFFRCYSAYRDAKKYLDSFGYISAVEASSKQNEGNAGTAAVQ